MRASIFAKVFQISVGLAFYHKCWIENTTDLIKDFISFRDFFLWPLLGNVLMKS